MPTIKLIKNIIGVSLLSFLFACGGGEGGADAPSDVISSVLLSGQVADGYLVGARVFLDRNGNKVLDAGEPWTESGPQGRYTLEVESGEGGLYPVVAEIIAGQTIDEDQPNQYVSDSYLLEAPVGKAAFISPLTTLVKSELDKNSSFSMQDAENTVRSQLGLNAGISLFENYIQTQGGEEVVSAHRAARIIAGLMGELHSEIETNVGGGNVELYRAAITLMVSDNVMNNCDAIAQGIAVAVDAVAIENIKSAIMAEINIVGLDSVLLERYVDRMLEDNPVWDMMPPEILSQNPPVDGNASIDVVVAMSFDEDIDPASIYDGAVQLIGPNGLVSGTVTYDSTQKQLNFAPDNYLMAFSSYRVALVGITDSYGNPLDQADGWSFMTIFDQLPPELPVF